tara:strand:- start:49 stop:432 length:384 start_codon:yes stop_codon:yes gene_type:complete
MEKANLNMQNTHPPLVIYDGKCPLCSREIAHYKKRKGAINLKWIDANEQKDFLESIGMEQKTVLEKFHVRRENGNWEVGAAGFVYMWSFLWPYKFLSHSIRLLHLLPALERAYALFLKVRNRKRCQL